ncbi:MAG TPA: ABC transporter substrate-binding protein [Burkholderiales bacterium]|nr:ABC transporter substrate-binding protein [Burkholderiales bacterium]
MGQFTRRDAMKALGAAAVTAAVPGARVSAAPDYHVVPEKGAKLRLLRWKRFVQGDEDLWMANTRKFTEQTGIEVRVESENFEDIRPKAAVAANVGTGPDIVIGWYDDPQLYPDKLVDLTELANYLGAKYGGWYDVCKRYGMRDNRWIGLPLGAPCGCVTYRQSQIRAAGFDTIPKDFPGFLKLCQALKAKRTPAGLALGNAVGDANGWCHWVVWGHGGKLVDEHDRVAINSKETWAALEYAKELYQTFIPGTLSWLDPNNNKAFLAGEISLTFNGISIYYVAKTSKDPALNAIAADIGHTNYPVGPIGRSAELQALTQAFVFKYTNYPNAAKEYLRFMWEKEQYWPWQEASMGYVTQPLAGYEANPVWTEDPKRTPFRDSLKKMQYHGYAGSLGPASAAALADYIMVNMVAEAASGASTAKAAAARAEKRAQRYYKS